jgi:GNAT superfamily N-acetyltransferase
MTRISVVDYVPDSDLDAELADLSYAAVHGWSDQRPITASLVRSRLRRTGMTATTLALHRDAEGKLVGAAALRWPAILEANARLWGPVVHPTARGRGIGRALLTTVAKIVATHPGIRVRTAEIPESRTCGWSLFERAGWRGSGTSSLLERPLAATEPFAARVPVRTVHSGEYLDPALAALFAGARPHLGYATARDTYTRWKADERYTPSGLLLVDGSEGLLGAALVYPLRHGGSGEPAEALLADLITAKHLDPATEENVRTALVGAALDAGARAGAIVARAVVDDADLITTLLAAGFQLVDRIRYYTPPAGASAVPTSTVSSPTVAAVP